MEVKWTAGASSEAMSTFPTCFLSYFSPPSFLFPLATKQELRKKFLASSHIHFFPYTAQENWVIRFLTRLMLSLRVRSHPSPSPPILLTPERPFKITWNLKGPLQSIAAIILKATVELNPRNPKEKRGCRRQRQFHPSRKHMNHHFCLIIWTYYAYHRPVIR